VPAEVVTVTSTVPAAWAGEVAVIELPEPATVKPAAAVPPKDTAVAPLKFVPLIITEVPPAVEPDVALTPLTAGAADGAGEVNAAVPLGVPRPLGPS